METSVQIIARNPGQMVESQDATIAWCVRKLEAVDLELVDAVENYETAKKNKWRSRSWKTRINALRKRGVFYEKVKEALEAGYYIVPPFPVDIFAIRINRDKPSKHKTEYRWSSLLQHQKPDLLISGDGRYVSDEPKVAGETHKRGDKQIDMYWPDKFQDVDFPLSFVNPAVLETVSEAMALKLFDQLGILPARRRTCGDPLVVGHIIPPFKRWAPLTFFIVWWMDFGDF